MDRSRGTVACWRVRACQTITMPVESNIRSNLSSQGGFCGRLSGSLVLAKISGAQNAKTQPHKNASITATGDQIGIWNCQWELQTALAMGVFTWQLLPGDGGLNLLYGSWHEQRAAWCGNTKNCTTVYLQKIEKYLNETDRNRTCNPSIAIYYSE